MSRLRFSVVLAALALLLGLTAAVPSASADEPAPPADPMLGAPKAGQCYLTKPKQNLAPSLKQAPISCKKKHTLWVLGAFEASPKQLAALSNEQFPKPLRRACAKRLKKALGKPKLQALSAYQPFLFIPPASQQDQGARWMSCAVGILANAPKLRVVKTRKPVKLTRSMPAKVRSCLTATRVTNCADKHGWRAVHAKAVTWPRSARKAEKLAQKICSRHVRPGMFRYRGYYAGPKPTHFMVCYTKSKR